MLHEIIWQQNARLAEVCLHHPFVRGLADGTLDPEAFRRYVAQDGFFLNAFARAYALAAAGSQDGETLISLCELLNGVLRELQLHAGFSLATVSGGSSLYGLLACDRLGSAGRARRSRPYTLACDSTAIWAPSWRRPLEQVIRTNNGSPLTVVLISRPSSRELNRYWTRYRKTPWRLGMPTSTP